MVSPRTCVKQIELWVLQLRSSCAGRPNGIMGGPSRPSGTWGDSRSEIKELKEELKQKREKFVDAMKGREQAEGRLGLVTGRPEEVETSLEKANRESSESRAVIKKTKGEVERLRMRYNETKCETRRRYAGRVRVGGVV